MKRILYFSIILPFLVIIFLTILLSSCEITQQQPDLKESSVSSALKKANPNQSIKNPYKQIGEMHNEALDAVFLAIKKNSSNIKCIDDLINTSQQSMNEYWWNKKTSIDDKTIKKAFENQNYKNYFLPKDKFLTKLSEQGLTEKQLEFIDGYYNLIDEKMSMNDLKKSIADMNLKGIKQLGEHDAKYVLLFSSIFESSYEYHSQKHLEWLELIKSLPIEGKKDNKLKKTTDLEIDWKAVWQADVSALVSALVSCAESLLFTAYPACVSAYTAYASCIVLLYECIDILITVYNNY